MKTSDLSDAALDWAVCQIEKAEWYPLQFGKSWYSPSSNWAQGGPIIEKYSIQVVHGVDDILAFTNIYWWPEAEGRTETRLEIRGSGKTYLEAAMRCYVASKLGDEVDIPKELL